MKVLVACEFSGVVRDAFIECGHYAISCDLLPSESDKGEHHQGDVLDFIRRQGRYFDLMIAHPPCTYLSYVGNRHWNAPGREEKRLEAMRFFRAIAEASIPMICIENPVGWPMRAYRKPDQVIHPYYFGDNAKKRTCLWLKNLPRLKWVESPDLFDPVTAVPEPKPLYYLATTGKPIHFTEGMRGVKDRGHARSKFWPGIAKAMSAQWGLLDQMGMRE